MSPPALALAAATLLLAGCSSPPIPSASLEPTVDRSLPADGQEDRLRRLFDFSDAAQVARWASLDDRVMGGVSRSGVVVTDDGAAAFTGTMSLDQGGGFASVRAGRLELDLGDWTGLALRVRGDGNRYKVRLSDRDRFDTVTYQAAIVPPTGEWQEVRVPFSAFRPVWRGRPVPDAPALRPDHLRWLGLLISDGQAGPFRLELAWIAAYR